MRILIIIGLLVSGCASMPKGGDLRGYTAKLTRCDVEDVKIEDVHAGRGQSQWHASCGERRFKCVGNLVNSFCTRI